MENSVVVEIDTIDLSGDSVENVIADPIEVLLGSLEGVYLVSAKYRSNKAIIDVRFSETSTDPNTLVTLVEITIDGYLDKLPDNIDSISVSLGEIPEHQAEAVEKDPAEPKSKADKPALSLLAEPSVNEKASNTEKKQLIIEDSKESKVTSGTVRSVEQRSMIGRYLGSIQSSNEYLPIITTLIPSKLAKGDVGSGSYFMSEKDTIVKGEIFDCFNNTGNVLTCQWRDKYGTGGVDLMFTPDYRAFNGRWSINGTEGAFKWSGLKVKDN